MIFRSVGGRDGEPVHQQDTTADRLRFYLGNHRWTFAAKGAHAVHFPRFTAIALAGLSLNQAIVYVMVEVMVLDYRDALIIVVLVVPALSFVLNRGWVFSRAQ